ncbi:hypothetical protein HG263_01135 [Pseudoalteromonas sp. JBTF-M23]|uniref:Uncharacterized protein n=1 Tax=Pseudoalteromonas caenipelagi TaxID=2726988 RepID=A0A849V7F5_9GAMM|nr:hypothetical protein [Pseudoalteromonas caenipelagi]NOU49156.1 hypothetical protein [Pseudoalteromonas caenipelagi]
MDLNTLTKYIKMALDLLFVKDPVATSMGVLFGCILHLLLAIVSLFVSPAAAVTEELSKINIAYLIALGIFILNWKNFLHRPKISYEAEYAIALLKQGQSEGLISKTDARLQYKRIVTDEIDKLVDSMNNAKE